MYSMLRVSPTHIQGTHHSTPNHTLTIYAHLLSLIKKFSNHRQRFLELFPQQGMIITQLLYHGVHFSNSTFDLLLLLPLYLNLPFIL